MTNCLFNTQRLGKGNNKKVFFTKRSSFLKQGGQNVKRAPHASCSLITTAQALPLRQGRYNPIESEQQSAVTVVSVGSGHHPF